VEDEYKNVRVLYLVSVKPEIYSLPEASLLGRGKNLRISSSRELRHPRRTEGEIREIAPGNPGRIYRRTRSAVPKSVLNQRFTRTERQ
jgi:hypothetical protein